MHRKTTPKLWIVVNEVAARGTGNKVVSGPTTVFHSDTHHMLFGKIPETQKIIAVNLDKQTSNQWDSCLDAVQSLINKISEKSIQKWSAEEISVGMTISAEGQLAFIAKAGLAASINVVYKRRTDGEKAASNEG
ncbi:MAG TPA: hypothetical protein VMG59_09945 [Phycisphaerae bacterium]|nr:hypothetical protein [Phycisphaerae bacterium]